MLVFDDKARATVYSSKHEKRESSCYKFFGRVCSEGKWNLLQGVSSDLLLLKAPNRPQKYITPKTDSRRVLRISTIFKEEMVAPQ